jgi:chromate reductase, NAD(P)H dehydrogenase (quinone)
VSIQILGIAGSLRKASHNRALLERIGSLLGPSCRFDIFERMTEIPMFNEDIEDSPPAAVRALWHMAHQADLIVFASPEYNQALPAATKNIVDWLSRDPSGSPLKGKRAAITGATVGIGGTRLAQTQLRGTLAACGALVMVTPMLFMARIGAAEPDEALLEQFASAMLSWATEYK